MKQLLLASAVAALSVTAAQAAPTAYGDAFLGIDAKDGTLVLTYMTSMSATTHRKYDRTPLKSFHGHVGVKGAEALTNDLSFIYQAEYGVEVAHGELILDEQDEVNADYHLHDAYVGLSHKQLGTLRAGRLASVDGMVDYANVTKGKVLDGDAILAEFNAPTANKTITYTTPTYNGVTVAAMYVNNENKPTDTYGANAYGVAVKYEKENAKAGVSYITVTEKEGPYEDGDKTNGDKALRVSGSIKLNPEFKVGALYQNHKDHLLASTENTIALSGTYDIANSPVNLYTQLDLSRRKISAEGRDDDNGLRGEEINKRLVAGVEYEFNKHATAHLYGAALRGSTSLHMESTGGQSASDIGGIKEEALGVGAGISYKF